MVPATPLALAVTLVAARPLIHLAYGPAFDPSVPAVAWLLPGIGCLAINTVLMNLFASCGMPPSSCYSPLLALVVNVAAEPACSCRHRLRRRLHLVERRVRADAGDQPALPAAAPAQGDPCLSRPSGPTAGQLRRAPRTENVYGSRKRLQWVLRHVAPADDMLEVGCGTGYMLCRPLARLGYDVHGIDIDAKSIEHGQALLREAGPRPRHPDGRGRCREANHAPDRRHRVGGARAPARRRSSPALLAEIAGAPRRRAGPCSSRYPTATAGSSSSTSSGRSVGLGRLLYRSGFCHLVEKPRRRGTSAPPP